MLPLMDSNGNVTQLTTVVSRALDQGRASHFCERLTYVLVFLQKLSYGESNCFSDDLNGSRVVERGGREFGISENILPITPPMY